MALSVRRLCSLLLVLPLIGCVRPQRPPAGRFAHPADNQARLMATTLKDTAEARHWKWSLLGDRNWVAVAVDESAVSLLETYPLNAAGRSGGCPTWEIDLAARRDSGAWRWKLTAHGSNGRTASKEGVAQSLTLRATGDADVSLPAEVRLADRDGEPIWLRVPR